jgi:sporulation related protein
MDCHFLLIFTPVKLFASIFLFFIAGSFLQAQDNAATSASQQTQTQLKVKELVEKKAEYNRLTGGEQEGYRIKIHSGVDSDAAAAIRTKFSARFGEYSSYKEYRLPDFVVLVGDFKTKLEAFESLKKIKPEFPNAFIVKGKIKVH